MSKADLKNGAKAIINTNVQTSIKIITPIYIERTITQRTEQLSNLLNKTDFQIMSGYNI